jgi:hypothetical protein
MIDAVRASELRQHIAAREYPGDLSPQGFAWEFLRRNPKYRTDFFEWHAAHANDEISARAPMVDKWALFALPRDPDRPGARDMEFVFDVSGLPGKTVVDFGEGPSSPHVSILFDVSMPIDAQVAAADRLLRSRQMHLKETGLPVRIDAPRYSCANLVRYLQILDLLELNVTDDELAGLFWPRTANEYPDHKGRKAARKARQTALRIRDIDYRDVARLKVTTPKRRKIR